MSWASVVKRAPSTKSSQQTQEHPQHPQQPQQPQQPSCPSERSEADFIRKMSDINQRALATLASEEQAQCRPTLIYMIRPDAPSAWPIFKTEEEQHRWMYNEEKKTANIRTRCLSAACWNGAPRTIGCSLQ